MTIFEKLREMVREFDEVERLIVDPAVLAQPARYAALMKRRGALNKYVSRFREWEEVHRQRDEAAAMASDPEMKRLAEEEVKTLTAREEALVRELEDLVLSEDREGASNAIVEVRPGTGGEEASLFAAELLRMYTRFAERKGWTLEIMDQAETDLGGLKSATISISGEDVFKHLRYESGTHRVQRVPATEAAGRIHTSAATVAVLPEAEEVDITFRPEDLEIKAVRASGPGGQHVNKTSSAVSIKHLPSGLVVECMTQRSQHQNKDYALRLLRTRLQEKAVSEKKAERDAMRRNQIGSGDRSEKIRTYNFPQSRITDHRVGFTTHALQAVLDGALDEMVSALQEADRAAQLKAMAKGK